VEGALYFQMKEKFKIDLIGRYFSYSLKNNIFAWNLPQMQIILRGQYNIFDKFILNVDVNLEGWRRAMVYTAGKNVFEENGQFGLKLGFLADANIGFEYRYNKRISMFLNFNNVAAQRYKRWYNYPVQGFQAMLGATFRF
jgi:outer membrane receptor protein involved in Fe transport